MTDDEFLKLTERHPNLCVAIACAIGALVTVVVVTVVGACACA